MAVALLLWYVQNIGYQRGLGQLTEYIAKEATTSIKLQARLVEVVHETQVVVQEKIKIVREKAQTIVKEVPVYVTPDDNAACQLRAGFVREHDAAATNQPAGGPSESDRAAGGVTLSETLSTIAENYGTCLKWREQVIGWQGYYEKLRSEIKAICKG